MSTAFVPILIVDDEPLYCDDFCLSRKTAGHLTPAISIARKALELMELEKVDLILLAILRKGE